VRQKTSPKVRRVALGEQRVAALADSDSSCSQRRRKPRPTKLQVTPLTPPHDHARGTPL